MFLDALRAVKTGEFPSHAENRVNDSNPAIVYSGNWQWEFPVQGCYCNDQTSSSGKGDYLEFEFVGTKVTVIGECGPHNGVIEVYIDGKCEWTIDLSRNQLALAQTWFESEELQEGKHQIKIINTGQIGSVSDGARVALDGIRYY